VNSSRSWLVWGVAVFAYVIAVTQRSSLGVAGIEAAARYEVSASVLSTLAVVQLIVYAALQVPVGVVLDRVGPRVLIIVGAALMLIGQVAVAFAPDFGVAVVGRILVGAGDATTFISVLRLLTLWFSGRILPQVSQWTGNIGQLGQVISAVPFAWILHEAGWAPAFVGAAAASALALLLAVLVVRNGPRQLHAAETATSWKQAMRQLGEALRRPGTQLGFWTHFTTQSPGSMFSLLWGFPMLVGGLGYSSAEAATLLSLLIVSGIVAGPVLGLLTVRHPMRKSNMVFTVVGGTAITWSAVLLWPGEPPLWLICVLIAVLGVGGPGSLIGFEFARQFNPQRSHGSATGFVNVGGFVATFIIMFAVGILLDIVDQARVGQGFESDMFAWDSFRIALTVQFLVVGVGVVALVRARRRTRRLMRADDGIEVAPLWVVLSRALRRRRG
jgi:sugar phosphate permease